MQYTTNEFSGMPSGRSAGAGQSGGNWSSRSEGEGQRAFAVSAAPAGSAGNAGNAGNQPSSSQGQFSSPYTTGGPAGNAPGPNGSNRSALGTLIIRPLPSEEGAQTREITLDGRDIAIGRSPACDVVLEGDQLVSRRHALLRFTGGRYTIVDLGSSNGTYINDVEIHQNTPLNDGDLITIGEHEMVYSERAPSTVAPGAASAGTSGGLGMGQEQRAPRPSEAAAYPAPGSIAASDLFDVSAAQTLLEPQGTGQSPTRPEPVWTPPAQPQAQPTQLPTGAPQFQPPAPGQLPSQAQYQAQPPVQPKFQPLASQPSAPEVPAVAPPMRGATTTTGRNTNANLQAVRVQLDEANQRLAQAEEEESRLAEQRRAGLVEVRDRLNAILAEQRRSAGGGYSAGVYGASGSSAYGGSEAANPNTAGLVTLARQTAQNPRQIDYMMQLASRAGEIASALESAQSRPSGPSSTGGTSQVLLSQLEALRARLDELIG